MQNKYLYMPPLKKIPYFFTYYIFNTRRLQGSHRVGKTGEKYGKGNFFLAKSQGTFFQRTLISNKIT